MRPALRLSPALIATVLLLVLAGCGDDGTAGGSSTAAGGTAERSVTAKTAASPGMSIDIKMEGIKFEPDEVTIMTGTTIVWTNKDPVNHNVTAADGSFASGDLGKGGTFSYTFEEPGTYEYVCTLHPPDMKGKVTVEK